MPKTQKELRKLKLRIATLTPEQYKKVPGEIRDQLFKLRIKTISKPKKK